MVLSKSGIFHSWLHQAMTNNDEGVSQIFVAAGRKLAARPNEDRPGPFSPGLPSRGSALALGRDENENPRMVSAWYHAFHSVACQPCWLHRLRVSTVRIYEALFFRF